MPSPRRIIVRQLAGILLVAALVAVAIVLIRGSHGGAKTVQLPAATASGQPASHISFLERLIPPPSEVAVGGPAAPRSLADLARRLPLGRAVAQLFLFGFDGKDASAPILQELQRLDVGGLVLDNRNYESPQQLAALTGALRTAVARVKHVPPWLMAEQDGGDYSAFASLPPTHPPGDFHSPAAAAAALGQAAATLEALGVNGLLEPDLDVSDTNGVLGAQAFASDPALVASYATRTVALCQKLRLFCAAKHFPGIGAAGTATDEGPAQVGLSLAQLMQRDVKPFAAAIKAHVPGIVVGEGLYEPDDFVTPAALSQKIIGGLLRRRLHFGGLAITDDLADAGVSSFAQIPDAAVEALEAGADMVYISGEAADQDAAYSAVLAAVRAGRISEAQIRASLLRILVAKRRYGLLAAQPASRSGG